MSILDLNMKGLSFCKWCLMIWHNLVLDLSCCLCMYMTVSFISFFKKETWVSKAHHMFCEFYRRYEIAWWHLVVINCYRRFAKVRDCCISFQDAPSFDISIRSGAWKCFQFRSKGLEHSQRSGERSTHIARGRAHLVRARTESVRSRIGEVLT